MEKKSFVEKVGEDNAVRLIELFLQNETFHQPTLGEIVKLIPEAKFTIGRLAGIRRDHDTEIKTLKTAYLVQFEKVPPVGETNILSPAKARRRAFRFGGLSPLAAQLAELTLNQCHYIVGDRYCGRSAKMHGGAGPYCEDHAPSAPPKLRARQ